MALGKHYETITIRPKKNEANFILELKKLADKKGRGSVKSYAESVLIQHIKDNK